MSRFCLHAAFILVQSISVLAYAGESVATPLEGLRLDMRPPPAPVSTPARPACRQLPTSQLAPREVDRNLDGERLAFALAWDVPLVAIRSQQAVNPPDRGDQLRRILLEYQSRSPGGRNITALAAYLQASTYEPLSAALWLNLGLESGRQGYFNRAEAAFERAWTMSRDDQSVSVKSLADRSLSELLALWAWAGAYERVDTLLPLARARGMQGIAERRLHEVICWREWLPTQPAQGAMCGPFAVGDLLKTARAGRTPEQIDHAIAQVLSQIAAEYGGGKMAETKKGGTLTDVRSLAVGLGLPMRVVKCTDASAALPIPAIVHWKLNHYSAVLHRRDGMYSLNDPAIGRFGAQDLWVTREAIAEAGSGYVVIPEGPVPSGWIAVADDEAKNVWGRGTVNGPPVDPPCPGSPAQPSSGGGGGGSSGCGMPIWGVHLSHLSLALVDAPLFYKPAVGPPVVLEMRYSEADNLMPGLGQYGNLGPKWTLTWFSSIAVTSMSATKLTAVVYLPGGGGVTCVLDKVGATNVFRGAYTRDGGAQLEIDQYAGVAVVTLADGGQRRYQGRGITAGLPAVHFFMTSHTGSNGLGLQFSYDASYRLVGVTDALGQVTTLSYNGVDSLKITDVVDPFGRVAHMTYNNGRLASITDVVSLTSSFTYIDGSSDIIQALTTPYGTTSFVRSGAGYERTMEVVDPAGDRYRYQMSGTVNVPATAPVAPTGTRIPVYNNNLFYRNVFYWDRKAMKMAPGDYAKARVYHYLHGTGGRTSSLLESMKEPNEERVWFIYPGQTSPVYDTDISVGKPEAVARVLDDGSSQIWKYTYLPNGHVSMIQDPQGRQTHISYAANAIDVVEIRQGMVGTAPVDRSFLAGFAYNAYHQVTQQTDASGQVTQFDYNALRQLETVTLPQRPGQGVEQIQFVYHPTTHQLVSVTGPGGVATGYTYDGYGRVQSVTGPDGYALVFAYDNLDRLTRVTYPDTTYEQIAYDRLDASWQRDRAGNWSRQWYDTNRKVVAQRDAQGQMTTFDWCRCGALKRIVDPAGRITLWEFDVQGRMTKKIYPDGSAVNYAYEPRSGRLSSVTDAKGQVVNMAYAIDDRLQRVWYTNAAVPTPEVNFTYDGLLGRIATMIDGVGTTTYGYAPLDTVVPSPALTDRGQLTSVDGPLSNDTATFAYDPWGRATGMTINGAVTSMTFDAIGRIANLVNPMGTFQHAYVGLTPRLDLVTAPNGMQTVFGYSGLNQDFRLESILHRQSGGQRVVENTYGYGVTGEITSWTRQNGAATAESWLPSYDGTGQLVGMDIRSGGTSGSLLQALSYVYDGAGNRLSSSVSQGASLSVSTASFNTANQLTQLQGGGGKMRVLGHLDEPGTVKVQGADVAVRANKSFTTVLDVPAGTSTFAVQATDLRGNSTTKNYQVNAGTAGTARIVAYDLNGNTTSDGLRSYTWDANDRLLSITQGTAVTVFTYDGLGRRVRLLETDNGVTVADRTFVWVGGAIVEERDGASIAQKRYFGNGFQILTGVKAGYYTYARDHLGSIQAITDSTGSVRAQYAYTPWGERTQISGDVDTDEGFTGHWHHRSGLVLSWFRAYDPQLGRWLSRDPIKENGGLNLYAYVGNSPIGRYDPLGLAECGGGGAGPIAPPIPGGGAGGGVSIGVYDPLGSTLFKNGAIQASDVALAAGSIWDVVHAIHAYQKANPGVKINSVSLYDHGNDMTGQRVGDEFVSTSDRWDIAALRELGRAIGPGGTLLLYGCNVGARPRYVDRVAGIAGITTIAWPGLTIYEDSIGFPATIFPNGKPVVGRPKKCGGSP